jgi:anti-sigma factor RsiW
MSALHPGQPGARGSAGPIGPHLGERVGALVDGDLTAEARDRALVHLAGCAECQAEVESVRLLKARLSVLPAPTPPADLTARLLAIADLPERELADTVPARASRGSAPARGSSITRTGAGARTGAGSRTGAGPRPEPLSIPGRPATGRPEGRRPAGRVGRLRREPERRSRRGVRMAALAGAALSTVVVAVVGLSGPLGSEGRVAPVSQLTSSGSGSISPFVDVSRDTGLGPNMRPGAARPDSHP